MNVPLVKSRELMVEATKSSKVEADGPLPHKSGRVLAAQICATEATVAVKGYKRPKKGQLHQQRREAIGQKDGQPQGKSSSRQFDRILWTRMTLTKLKEKN
uniref:Uncharacterized protein n=1 Tax=Arundo donax TaxID=35708 RepID=A0A0A9CRF6_ARUDO